MEIATEAGVVPVAGATESHGVDAIAKNCLPLGLLESKMFCAAGNCVTPWRYEKLRFAGAVVNWAGASVVKDQMSEGEDPAAFLATICHTYDDAAVMATGAVLMLVVFVRKGGGYVDPK